MGFASDLIASVSMAALVAGETLTAGQMVALAADNTVYGVADPNNPATAPNWRSVLQAATATGVVSGSQSLNQSSGFLGPSKLTSPQSRISCQLANGNVAIAYADTTASGNVFISIVNQAGAQVLAPTKIVAAGGGGAGGSINICALTGGGFAVCYFAGGATLSFQVFNAAGALQGTVNTTAPIVAGATSMAPLSNGNFAYCTFNTGKAGVSHGVISAAGAQVLPLTSLGSTVTPQSNLAIAGLSGGGYVVFFGTSSITTQVSAFTNAGAANGTVPNAIAMVNGSAPILNIVGLSGGGFSLAINCTNTSTTGLTAQVYNAALVQQGANIALSTTSTTGQPPMMCPSTNGSVYVAWGGGTTTVNVAKIGANGAQIGATFNPTVSGSPTVAMLTISPQPDDGCFVYVAGTSTIHAAVPISPTLTQTTTSFTITAPIVGSGGVDCYVYAGNQFSPGMTVNITLCSAATNALWNNAWAYSVQKAQVIGVSDSAAGAGASIQVQYGGKAQLTTGWLQPYMMEGVGYSSINVVGQQVTMQPQPQTKACGVIGGVLNSSISFTAPVDCNVAINWWSANGGSAVTVNGTIINASLTSTALAGLSQVYVAEATTIVIGSTGTTAGAFSSYVEV